MASILVVWTGPVSRSCRRIGNISHGRLAIGITISNWAICCVPKVSWTTRLKNIAELPLARLRLWLVLRDDGRHLGDRRRVKHLT